MKRLVFVVGVLTFLWWRHERFERWDRQHGFGPYARVVPEPRA